MDKRITTWRWRIYKTGMNMREFCRKHGIRQAQLSDWLNGRKTPKTDSIEKIETMLKAEGV